MIRRFSPIIVASLMVLGTSAFAQTAHQHAHHQHHQAAQKASATDLSLSECWVRFRADNASGLFVKVKNNDAKNDAFVVGAASPAFAEVMVHETYEQDGMKGMRHVGEVAIPAGGETLFKPGSYHMMAMKPTAGVKEGDKIDLTLKLSNGHEAKTQCVLKAFKAQSFKD